jgi:hypothetical protein
MIFVIRKTNGRLIFKLFQGPAPWKPFYLERGYVPGPRFSALKVTVTTSIGIYDMSCPVPFPSKFPGYRLTHSPSHFVEGGFLFYRCSADCVQRGLRNGMLLQGRLAFLEGRHIILIPWYLLKPSSCANESGGEYHREWKDRNVS